MGTLKTAVALTGLCILLTDPARGQTPTSTDAHALARTCSDYNENRNVYFGDMHVHTALSFDAYGYKTRVTPEEAYRFAKGEIDLSLPGELGDPARPIRLEQGEALDFAAITDHAEYAGALAACTFANSEHFNAEPCKRFRDARKKSQWGGLTEVCDLDASACATGKWLNWKQHVDAANAANEPCSFTAFAGYEWTRREPPPPRKSTGVEGVRNDGERHPIHRTVIYKNHDVPMQMYSSADETKIFDLWKKLADYCNDNPKRACDSITIPHNSHGSAGAMFAPYDSDYRQITRQQAELRARMEPIVEVFQSKQSSECSFLSGRCQRKIYDRR